MLDICEKDDNLLPLKRGRDFGEASDPDNPLTQRRRILMISDGYGYDSTKQATSTSFSSPDVIRLKKHPRYLGDTMFAFGDDHYASMAAQVKVGGPDSILSTIESGLELRQVAEDEIPPHVLGTDWEPFASMDLDIYLDVPRKDGSSTPCDLGFGADASSACSLASTHGPTSKFYSCDKCMVARKDQGSDAKCEAAIPRTFLNTHALAHFHIGSDPMISKLIPNWAKRKYGRRLLSKCPAPNCGKELSAASVRADTLRKAAMSATQLAKEDLIHRKSHFDVHWLQRQYVPHSTKRVARDGLHSTTNTVGNTIVVTFNAVPYEGDPCPKRVKANKFLRSKGVRIPWRFSTKRPPKKNARPRKAPIGPAARKFLNNPLVLPTLHTIFYGEELSTAEREELEEAAEAAQEVMGADADAEARSSRGQSRASQARRPQATSAGESSRPRAGGSSGHASDAQSDGGDSNTSAAESFTGQSADDEGDSDVEHPDEDSMESLPDDVTVGGKTTSARAWLDLMKFQIKAHEDFDDRLPAERTRNGIEGQALGKKWRDSLNRHCGGNANWFYPHNEAFHYREDVEANGSRKGTSTDAHEAKNKIRRQRKKRIFGGGARNSNTSERAADGARVWHVPLKVADVDDDGNETGTYHTTWYYKKANAPDFKYQARHEAITRCLEMERPAPRALKPQQQDVKADKDGKRDAERLQLADAMLRLAQA